MADIEFFFDPICPFAWLTSRWVHQVIDHRGGDVAWRFISLRLINADKDYATEFPPEYPQLHQAGLRMLRVAAEAEAATDNAAVGRLYTAFGESMWDRDPSSPMDWAGSPDHLRTALEQAGLSPELAAAADEETHDALLAASGEEALSRTGRDVGTPIITYRPPDGVSFFGPVISRLPADGAEACDLWDAVLKLAAWPGFAELKRSLREMPQLRVLGG